tara:strand:- start:53 stop:532 length:480 start_codon:yes stop_codon:yes gene_type:complete
MVSPTKGAEIQWLTMEEAYEKTQKEPKKILVDVYTDWCGWCKVMDRGTFRDEKVVAYVNEHYYAVKFDAEQTKPVMLGNLQFDYVPENKIHQLALSLTNNTPSFPTTVFLDEKFQMIQPLPGYMKAKEFHEVITFFGEGYYKKLPFENYKKTTYRELFK